jgi:PAS domain S-box-containing protein
VHVYPSVEGLLVIFRDISARRQMEAELRQSKDRLQLITEAAGVGGWSVDLAYLQASFDDQSRRLFHLTEDFPLEAARLQELVRPEDWPRVEKATLQMMTTPERQEVEFRMRISEKDERWLYLRGQAFFDEQGYPTHLVGVVMDITNRKQSEADYLAGQAQIEVQRRLLEQREQERLQIARDLHDGPVQELTGAHYALEGILYTTEDKALAQALQVIRDSIKQEVNGLRDYAGELRPPTLSKFGLGKAIRSHLESFQEKHPEIRLELEETHEGTLLPEEVSLALFRIYQETLTNFTKHARATKGTVRLISTPGQVILEMEDNGVGFSVPKDWLELARRGHLGLVGMRERAEAIGGRLQVDSQPGQGSRIQVVVPIQNRVENSSFPS